MKTIIKNLVLFLATLVPLIASAEPQLNIYSWGNYLPQKLIDQFTKETGIKVNLSEYDNNETMFSKLKALGNNSDYDLVIPSSYYVERMGKLGMLKPLNKSKLNNLHHLNPLLLNRGFDPKNKYSIPYLWGSTGITINTKYITRKKISSWKNFWDSSYRNQLMIIDDMRDAFSTALLVLGYSINDRNPQHIKEAYLRLKSLLPNIKIFSIDMVPNIYIDEDATIGMAWSGDFRVAKEENQNLEYIYPKEGFSLWVDSFAILNNAPHPENAYKFINFMLRPDNAKEVTLAIGHTTANQAAIKLMPLKFQKNPVDNPSTKIMHQGHIQQDLDEKTRALYEEYWEKLKINN